MKLQMILAVAAVVVVLPIVAMAWRPLLPINLLAAIDSRRTADGAPYGSSPRQVYDLYQPKADTRPAAGWPLVVFIYGGSWTRGERGDYRFVGESLAQRGVMTMVIDYRFNPEVKYPEFVRDSATAVAHALTQAPAWGADPKRVLVMGHSAGGYNAAMVALDPRWLAEGGHSPSELAGWIGLAGPYDFLPITNPDAQAAFNHPDVPLDSQPIHHVAGTRLPALLLAAHNDTLVNPRRNTAQLAAAIQATGATATTREYERLNHLTLVGAIAAPLRWLAPVLDDVVAFIEAQATVRTSPSP